MLESRTIVQMLLDEQESDRRAALNGDERAWARVDRDASPLQHLFDFIGRQLATMKHRGVSKTVAVPCATVMPAQRSAFGGSDRSNFGKSLD